MANADVKGEGVLQKPTSRTVTTLKIALNICFYMVSLTWIIYSTILTVEFEHWLPYFFVHSTIVGLITYKAVIDLKFKDSNFFKKNHLLIGFISFGITAPLAGFPFVITWMPPGDIDDIVFYLVLGGQSYWLLLLVQAAITIWGEKTLFLCFGYIIFIGSVLNVGVLLFIAQLFELGNLLILFGTAIMEMIFNS